MLSHLSQDSFEHLWPIISVETKEICKSELIGIMLAEQNRQLRKQVAEAVAEIAATAMNQEEADGDEPPKENEWPNFVQSVVPVLYNLASPVHLECLLIILENLFSAMGQYAFKNYHNELFSIIKTCMEHPDMDIQLLAVHAMASWIAGSQNGKERKVLTPLFNQMIRISFDLIKKDEQKVICILSIRKQLRV
jgi:hypothetical protein